MCRGCLPTRVRLQDKGVSCPTRRASCSSEHEDLNHILFECPFAIQVWNSAGIWHAVQDAVLNNNSAVDAIFHLFQNLPTHLQQRFAALCWSLWKHRNLKIWEDVNELSATVVDRACTVLEDWQEANKNLPCTRLQRAGQQAPSVTQA